MLHQEKTLIVWPGRRLGKERSEVATGLPGDPYVYGSVGLVSRGMIRALPEPVPPLVCTNTQS
jgi:hypothetical protein